jgi:hypothetical protein
VSLDTTAVDSKLVEAIRTAVGKPPTEEEMRRALLGTAGESFAARHAELLTRLAS